MRLPCQVMIRIHTQTKQHTHNTHKHIHKQNNICTYTHTHTTHPLSERVTEARWRMLGHILHMPSHTPGQLALKFAVTDATKYKGRRGRHQTNLPDIIRADLSKHQLKLQWEADLKFLQKLASDKSSW